MFFRIRGDVSDIETIAVGRAIRELPRLRKLYGQGRWRKRSVWRSWNCVMGTIRQVELHWHEATGIGKKEFKIKPFVD